MGTLLVLCWKPILGLGSQIGLLLAGYRWIAFHLDTHGSRIPKGFFPRIRWSTSKADRSIEQETLAATSWFGTVLLFSPILPHPSMLSFGHNINESIKTLECTAYCQ